MPAQFSAGNGSQDLFNQRFRLGNDTGEHKQNKRKKNADKNSQDYSSRCGRQVFRTRFGQFVIPFTQRLSYPSVISTMDVVVVRHGLPGHDLSAWHSHLKPGLHGSHIGREQVLAERESHIHKPDHHWHLD